MNNTPLDNMGAFLGNAEKSKKKKVFFSYSEETRSLAFNLAEMLSMEIIPCDRYDAVSEDGRLYQKDLTTLIKSSDLMIFVVSKAVVHSFKVLASDPPCGLEALIAHDEKKIIVPLLWELPTNMSDIPDFLKELHWVDFTDYRLSNMQDENALNIGWDRVRLGMNNREQDWMAESMKWYYKLEDWCENNEDDLFLLTKPEMDKFESFLRDEPETLSHVLDHPSMQDFINKNKERWSG